MFSKEFTKAFLFIFTPATAFITAGCLLYLYIQYNNDIQIIKKNEYLQLDLASKSIVRDLQNILPDMEILVNDSYMQNYISSDTPASKKKLEQALNTFSRSKRIYKQIRFLDNAGLEKIRIVYNENNASIIHSEIYQNKSDRYYFRESKSLGRGELYISPLDLNIENDIIEIPHAPTIRFVMPVFNINNVMQGIIALNYDASNMLNHFDEMLEGSYGHIALLNNESYWLRSHKKHREWAFMFNKDIRFNQKHPDEWDVIKSNNKGQIKSDDGLFTFVSIYPLKLIGGYDKAGNSPEHSTHHHIDPELYAWKVISDVPKSTLKKILSNKIFGLTGTIWLSGVILSFIASWYLTLSYIDRKKLRNQIDLHAKIYDSSTDGIIITNTNQEIIDINQAFEEICGYSRDEIIGNHPSMFSSGRHEGYFYQALWESLNKKGYWEGEITNRNKNGSIYTEWIRITAIKNSLGTVINYISLISDITHKKSNEAQLIKHAHHDPLTGVHNRLSFDERFKHDFQLAKRNDASLAVLYLDLDKFKPINDTYGHQAGDFILQNVTNKILNNIRETDTIARLGGDEFAIILTQVESRACIINFCINLKDIIRAKNVFDGKDIYVDVSIGYALYPDDADNEKELIAIADKEMFKDKRNNR